MILGYQRAVVMTALVFSAPFVFAKPVGAETYKDIIEKAHNLSLQNDRQQALNILSAAVKKETRLPAINELKRVAKELSQTFLSDKSQQLYESALSLRRTDVNQALERAAEARRLEPENSLIVLEQARLLVGKGDCRGAQESLQKQLSLLAFDEDLRLAQAQAAVCLEKWTDYQKAKEIDGHKKATSEFWLILEVEHQLSQKDFAKAQDLLAQIQRGAEKYPEQLYWQQIVEQKTKKPHFVTAQKYVMSCRNISVTLYRQYMVDPMLCRRVSEVEVELKGYHGAAE